LLSLNRFNVLVIEESNISADEPIDTFSLFSGPIIKTPIQKLKWERRLLKQLSASVLDAYRASFILPVKLHITDTNKVHSIKALLDCRVTDSFINRNFVCSKGINTQSIS